MPASATNRTRLPFAATSAGRHRMARSVDTFDWDSVRSCLADDESPIAAQGGWLVSGSIDPELDHPCTLFITDRALHFDIRPFTLLPEARVISVPFEHIEKCAVGRPSRSSTRIVVMYVEDGIRDESHLSGLAVDVPNKRRARAFAHTVVSAVGKP